MLMVSFPDRWGNIWQANEWHVISSAHHECHAGTVCLHSSQFADQALPQWYCTHHNKSPISQFDCPPLIAHRTGYSFPALIPHAGQL